MMGYRWIEGFGRKDVFGVDFGYHNNFIKCNFYTGFKDGTRLVLNLIGPQYLKVFPGSHLLL